MSAAEREELKKRIIEKAQELGACAAGIADVEALKQSPSHLMSPRIGGYKSFLNDEVPGDCGEVSWPSYAKSAIVVAVEHPEDDPRLDWWYEGLKGGTPGNQMLIKVISSITAWLTKEKDCKAQGLPYYIVQGGIFLKDAAVMAGLGCIGKNNMLVTPDFGPRVRLRAALVNIKLPATGPVDFDPCPDCDMPCRNACPQKAFQNKIHIDNPFGIAELPGRTGAYNRPLCLHQMDIDRQNASNNEDGTQEGPGRVAKCCRLCETLCPIGRK